MRKGKQLVDKLKSWPNCPMTQEEIQEILLYVTNLEESLPDLNLKQCKEKYCGCVDCYHD